ncbi:unnamed protein product, partial [Symbiodinium sp. CCMP2456]
MSSIDKSGRADPRLLGRESWPQQKTSGQKELEASKPRGSEAVEEVQPRPTRFRGLVGGAWQK